MDDSRITTLEQIKEVLKAPEELKLRGLSRPQRYAWMEQTLRRFDYFALDKKGKGLVRGYLARLSGYSRAAVTRLISRWRQDGTLRLVGLRRHRFAVKYNVLDQELLAETDNAHGRLSGPATRRILQREYFVYGDKRFERLKDISSPHIYNLRRGRAYRLRSQTFAKTRSVAIPIGIRRRPNPHGRPGYIRVDTVHQGDLNGVKGVYHINLVDQVTQWEIVVCVERISEAHLEPALEQALAAFPFVVRNFHSDNGGEFINGVVAKLLNKLLIKQTKSRSGRTNDNALVEGKNGSVIRKHMGYWHIEQRHAPLINEFYRERFNVYLNFHRPCGFATVTVDEKGRRSRKYETYQTPYERLKCLSKKKRSLRPGLSFAALDSIAAQHSDNEFAAMMQKAKDKLFRAIGFAPTSRAPHYPPCPQSSTERKSAQKERPRPATTSGSSLD